MVPLSVSVAVAVASSVPMVALALALPPEVLPSSPLQPVSAPPTIHNNRPLRSPVRIMTRLYHSDIRRIRALAPGPVEPKR